MRVLRMFGWIINRFLFLLLSANDEDDDDDGAMEQR